MFVFDATPLIYLAKAERLSLLSRLDTSRLIPQRVYEEVVSDPRLKEWVPRCHRCEGVTY